MFRTAVLSCEPHEAPPLRSGCCGLCCLLALWARRLCVSVVPDAVLGFLNTIRARRTHICVLEEIALVAPYFHPELREVFECSDVSQFADNTAANGAALKGYSPSEDIARLVFSFHVRLVLMQSRVWIEYVPSAANIADDPTRGEFERLHSDFNAEQIEFIMPPLEGWVADAPVVAA